MSNPGVGTDYEHHLSDAIYDRTDGDLVPLGAGYTTRHGSPVDLIIDDGEAVHVFELKKYNSDAYTFNWDPDDYQKDDLYNMCKFAVEYPRPTYPYVGIRFQNRQLACTKLYGEAWPDRDEILSDAVLLSPIEAKHDEGRVRNDSLRVYKPSTDDWPSQKSGDDVEHLLETIGYVL